MKIEKAIEWMEEAIQETTECFEQCSPTLQEELIKQKEVFELALTALRSMPEAREPLSLEQLREMNGKPVWIKCINPQKYNEPPVGWHILEKSIVGTLGIWDGESCLCERDYEKDWLAYTYTPAHIDRSKWEPCAVCENKTCRTCINAGVVSYGDPCCECDVTASGGSYYEHSNFCPHCGRPLTEEAWAELERRVRG